MLVTPETSPRNTGIAGEDDDWDFGTGADFYVDATSQSWRSHYQMYTYVVQELPALINEHFPAQPDKQSIFGHSMGGHGEQLKPELFEQACAAVKQPLNLRYQEGYDHSYYFIATFIEYHIRHHAIALSKC